jgi:lipoprotein NlpI/predicted aspartyl protease
MRNLVALFFVLLGLPALAEDSPAKCKLVKVGEWHIRIYGTRPVVDGAINGKPIVVLLSTGNDTSFIMKASADRLGLVEQSTSRYFEGVGGATRMQITRLAEFQVGGVAANGMRVRVVGERPFPGIDFVLGYDFFKTLDVEFDYPNGVARLFQPIDCKGKSLAYWDRDALAIPMDGSWVPTIPVTVNGHEATARISTGNYLSNVHLEFAKKLGIEPGGPDVHGGSCTSGFGPGDVQEWVARFDTIAIGGEMIRNARLRMADYYPDSGSRLYEDMVLGGDFLRSHRVLISSSQGMFYASYTGGQVFPTTPGMDCGDERVKGKSTKEAIAFYDAEIASNPSDAKALLSRARLRWSLKDLPSALTDLDAAIRIDPSSAVALDMRSRVRYGLGDYKGALADSSSAIAQGMSIAGMYAFRSEVRQRMGDAEGAVADLDEALRLDPHHQAALRMRGVDRFAAGAYDKAEMDFLTLLAIRPGGYESLWLYFSRARRGEKGDEPLEQGLVGIKDGEWPAPILRHLLGQIDRDALMAVAAWDEKTRKGRECEAHFYVAEELLSAGDKAHARAFLEEARSGCPTGFYEYRVSGAELERLQ